MVRQWGEERESQTLKYTYRHSLVHTDSINEFFFQALLIKLSTHKRTSHIITIGDNGTGAACTKGKAVSILVLTRRWHEERVMKWNMLFQTETHAV